LQQGVAELRAPVIERAKMTMDNHLATLADLRDMATKAEQYSAAIRAEESRGKAVGFYTTKLDVFATRGIRNMTTMNYCRLSKRGVKEGKKHRG
jgi:hypothetical protein